MNHCGIQQKNTFASSREDMRNTVSISVSFEQGEPMICPKPRRLNLFNNPINDPVKPLRWHMCYQPEPYEAKATLELLEIIFEKDDDDYGGSEEQCTEFGSFFCGSPPSRVSNPLTQDTRFGDEKISISASGMSSNPCSERKVGNFGNKPAVRIEGFDNRTIPARA